MKKPTEKEFGLFVFWIKRIDAVHPHAVINKRGRPNNYQSKYPPSFAYVTESDMNQKPITDHKDQYMSYEVIQLLQQRFSLIV
ncbi:MAG: hypothetical protein AAF519_05715 [Bacteroidota bacterium]